MPKENDKNSQKTKKKTRTWLNECATYEKNVAKWNAAKLFCEQNGLEFMIVSEKELAIKR